MDQETVVASGVPRHAVPLGSEIVSTGRRIPGRAITPQLPSKGWPLQKYRFAFWTQTEPGNNISTVASFAPESSMIPIGVLKSVSATR